METVSKELGTPLSAVSIKDCEELDLELGLLFAVRL
jgi:hypothetical protein